MPEDTEYEIGKVGLRAGFSRAEMFLVPNFSENISADWSVILWRNYYVGECDE